MRILRSWFVLSAREIESYFLAPLMYVVLAVFLVLNGFSFYLSIASQEGNVDASVRSFLGASPWFWFEIVLIPPIPTMRLIAEERRTGTLEGLMTAPVTDTVVVLAKFTGALAFYIALWAPSILYLVTLKSYGALPDVGILESSYLGVLLLGALLIAVGLLMSALAPNQIVAAILAIVANLVLFFAPLLAVVMGRGATRTALEHLALFFHFQDGFAKGIVDTGIVGIYVAGIGLCLFLAVRALEARRWA